MRSNDEIKHLIIEALQPVECVIEMQDDGTSIDVAIYLPDHDRIMLLDHEPVDKFRDGDALFQVLSHARKNIKKLGIGLEAWQHDDS